LVTGHTGFKGAWLSLWLQSLGAEVVGLSSGSSAKRSMFSRARVGEEMRELTADVRDREAVREAMRDARPEVVLHLAAQPLVRRALREPALTYEVNVLGTVNVLDAVRTEGEDVAAVVVVTSDKCYTTPPGGSYGSAEEDPYGGGDPYLSSKACAELVTAAYRSSFFAREGDAQLATARAGNVIGGGDWGEGRLLGDAVRALENGVPLRVRDPQAVRPWQHVLNPLAGYLRLAELLTRSDDYARAWNFRPPASDARSVGWIVRRLGALSGGGLESELGEWRDSSEEGYLSPEFSDTERDLGWTVRWDLEQALQAVVDWHEAERAGEDMRTFSLGQIESFGGARAATGSS
jgi:CDP-glucose 4,6-dehydratase